MKQEETKALSREIGDYVAANTNVIWVDDHTMQICLGRRSRRSLSC